MKPETSIGSAACAASRASVPRAGVVLAPIPAAVGAVYQVQGQAHAAVAPPACGRPSAVGKAMTCGYPPRAQCVSKRVSRGHVSAGQGRVVPRPPEP
jgi:hypothetical protein